jgi:DNA-binding IclR family transcriptional regulator
MDDGTARRSGTQTVERAALLLRELAAHGSFGWRASDLAAHCGLDRATTQRILACLARERLVQQREKDRRYLPGPLLFELGLSVPGLGAFQAICQAPVARAAARTGGVASLYLRSGDEFVCAVRSGTTGIRALSSEIGTRRPLVMSVGGVAILVALPEREVRAALQQGLAKLAHQRDDRAKSIERMVLASQERGYGFNAGFVVPGVNAFGVAVRNRYGTPVASLAVAGSTDELALKNADAIVDALRAEARVIEAEGARLLVSWNPAAER